MKATRTLTVASALFIPLFLAVVANGCSGCKKDETEAAPTAAPPPPAPTPQPVATVAPEEDAGLDAATDAAPDAHHVTGGGDPTGVKKCCQALRQNAKTAPPEQQGFLTAAAGMCDGLVNNPQGRQALSTVRSMLKGANIPAECK